MLATPAGQDDLQVVLRGTMSLHREIAAVNIVNFRRISVSDRAMLLGFVFGVCRVVAGHNHVAAPPEHIAFRYLRKALVHFACPQLTVYADIRTKICI